MKYDNTASIKLIAELSKYSKARKPAKKSNSTKAALKAMIRSCGAAWITDESEPIIGLIKGHKSANRETMEFAKSKGWVSVRDGGKYDNFHFTQDGLKIKDEVAATTCAFTGRRCKAMF